MGRARQQQQQQQQQSDAQKAVDGHDEEGDAGGFHNIVQPNRDPQSNFELDLAKKLEDYLLKICSGELTPDSDYSVNFAEAALLLQGSIQVYSRKVEYLYTLVLQALNFLSNKKPDNEDNSSNTRSNKNISNAVNHEDDDVAFLGLDDVPEESNIDLDTVTNRVITPDDFVKPPSNMLLLEGDCLDTSGGDAGELESYLLSTCDFYGDFLLLDPSDAVSIDVFQKENTFAKEYTNSHEGRGNSAKSRRQSGFFCSPTGRSGGASHHRKSAKKKQSTPINDFSTADLDFDTDCNNENPGPHLGYDSLYTDLHHEDNTGVGDSSDDESIEGPWKPLNPHESGVLKIKPFKKGKTSVRKSAYTTKKDTLACEFSHAKLDELVSPELADILNLYNKGHTNTQASQLLPLYEKLRQSFTLEEPKSFHGFDDDNNEDEFEDNVPDFNANDADLPQFDNDFDAAHIDHEKIGGDTLKLDDCDSISRDDLDSDANLEDLCRAHLDELLANIAENEKQTELAARVSTWKQRIEHMLEEQDSHPPFDIHLYAEKVLEKLCTSNDGENMSFTDIVTGQQKHEIARSFSALLQLVNNRSVDLDKMQPKNESFCHTGESPFYVKLLDNGGGSGTVSFPNKRTKSPSRQGITMKSSNKTRKLSVKIEKSIIMRCSPRKKRRRSPSSEHSDPQLSTR